MDDKELLIKIKREAEHKVPDMYDKILNAAISEGLLEETAESSAAYAEGDAVVLGGVNKKAVAITSLAAVAGICLAIALPVALSGNGEKIPPIPPAGITLELGEDYAVGAVSCAKLLGNFMEGSSAPSAKTAALRYGQGDEIAAFQKYFEAFETFFGETMANPVKSAEPHKKYANSIVIEGVRANSDPIKYAMYYTEARVDDSSAAEGDPVSYYIEGVISVGFGQMLLLGERTVPSGGKEGDETALTISAYPNEQNKDTYVKMEIERAVQDDVTVTKYNYNIVINGETVGGAVMHRPVQEEGKASLAFALDILDIVGTEGGISYNVFRPDGTDDQFNVDYKTKFDKGSFIVTVTESSYEYVLSGFLIYKLNGDGTCEVIDYDRNKILPETLVIPSSYEGNKVVAIGSGAFSSCRTLENVTVSEGIERIDSTAFWASSLKEIKLPSSLKIIEGEAFRHCENLTDAVLPEGLETIGSSAFNSCPGIKNLHIPASVKSIGSFTFDTGSLTAITVAESNAVYEGKNNCIIEKSSKTLLYGCINSSIPTDGSVTKIGNYAFYFCQFASFVVPEGVTEICSGAFQNCSKMKEVSLPETLKEIDSQAFAYCESLESFRVPASVTNISSSGILQGAESLTSITVESGNPFYRSMDNCLINKYTYTLIAGCKTSVIPSDGSVKIISNDAFSGISGLTQITIPSSVTEIGVSAFSYSGLTSIEIPDSVTVLEGAAFEGCENLTAVKLSENIKTLDTGLFRDCRSLEEITIPASVETFGSGVFQFCTNLKNVVLPANLKTIGQQSFESCTSLQRIEIPASVTVISSRAFYNCPELKDIVFNGSLDDWNAITKGDGWYYRVTDCTVTFSDGQTVILDWYQQFN